MPFVPRTEARCFEQGAGTTDTQTVTRVVGTLVDVDTAIADSLLVTDTTPATSISTGSGVFNGGIGVAGNVISGGTASSVTVVGTTSVTTPTITTTSGPLTLNPATATGTAKPIIVTNSTASTSTTTGAVIVTGGIGCAGKVSAGSLTTADISSTAPVVIHSDGYITLDATTYIEVKTSILPNPSATLDIGSAGNQFNDGYFSNAVITNQVNAQSIFASSTLTSPELNTGGPLTLSCDDNLVIHALAVTPDSEISLGTTTNKFSEVWATNGTIQTSSETLKQHMPLHFGLKELSLIRPVHFIWKDDPQGSVKVAGRIVSKRKHMGLLAENLLQVCPHMVHGDKPEEYGVNYAEMVPWLVKCIQELKAKNEELSKVFEQMRLWHFADAEDKEIKAPKRKRKNECT